MSDQPDNESVVRVRRENCYQPLMEFYVSQVMNASMRLSLRQSQLPSPSSQLHGNDAVCVSIPEPITIFLPYYCDLGGQWQTVKEDAQPDSDGNPQSLSAYHPGCARPPLLMPAVCEAGEMDRQGETQVSDVSVDPVDNDCDEGFHELTEEALNRSQNEHAEPGQEDACNTSPKETGFEDSKAVKESSDANRKLSSQIDLEEAANIPLPEDPPKLRKHVRFQLPTETIELPRRRHTYFHRPQYRHGLYFPRLASEGKGYASSLHPAHCTFANTSFHRDKRHWQKAFMDPDELLDLEQPWPSFWPAGVQAYGQEQFSERWQEWRRRDSYGLGDMEDEWTSFGLAKSCFGLPAPSSRCGRYGDAEARCVQWFVNYDLKIPLQLVGPKKQRKMRPKWLTENVDITKCPVLMQADSEVLVGMDMIPEKDEVLQDYFERVGGVVKGSTCKMLPLET